MRSSFSRAGLTLAVALIAIAPVYAASPAEVIVSPAGQPLAPAMIAVRMERHPEIRRAIASLERAKAAMQRANHDFGGHRVEALAACDNAIAQLRIALQYDK